MWRYVNTRWLVTGDSISKGIVFDDDRNRYVVLHDNYIQLAFDELDVSVANVSRFGRTIDRGLETLKRDVLKHQPDNVLVGYGGNDCDFDWDAIARDPHQDHKPRTELNRFRDVLSGTVKDLQNSGITPVLMTLPPLEPDRYFGWITRNNPEKAERILLWLRSVTRIYWWQERYNSVITRIAIKTGSLLVDMRAAFLQQPDLLPYICQDGIHPNQLGHRLMAEAFIASMNDKQSAPPLPAPAPKRCLGCTA
ncbi:SGNH/GDSL hydrolase family protein [candidate division KSB1 bacterium]|nr:SGNH/GDSL hydrolase family protein [candidate division KSB1 bacterium]